MYFLLFISRLYKRPSIISYKEKLISTFYNIQGQEKKFGCIGMLARRPNSNNADDIDITNSELKMK